MRPRTLIPLACLALAACAGPGAPPHGAVGAAQKDFAAPMSRVRIAAVSALGSRSMRIVALGSVADGETIRAQGPGGSAELRLERTGHDATRMIATVNGGAKPADRAAADALLADTARFLESAAR